jgi:ATP-dependent helicase/nuclease subunit B
MSAPSLPERVFTGWDRPVLEVALDWLCRGWSAGPLVLDDLLAIVPTAQSGRRLREGLATRAAMAGTGVLAPTVVTPEVLLTWGPGQKALASPLEVLAVWTRLLRDLDLSEFPALFPALTTPPLQDVDWALGVARRLVELRALLGEQGLTIAAAAARLGAAPGQTDAWEPGRWGDLCRLEERYLDRLNRFGLHDANLERREAAKAAVLPERVRRVVVVAVPDPQPLALEILARVAGALPVTVLVHAPASHADDMDEWGRPGPVWQQPTCAIPIPESAIHLVARPQDQARKAVQLLREATAPGLGLCDSEVLPHLELLLREAGTPAYDPAGTPLARTAIFELLTLAADLAADDRFDTAARLLRLPEVLAFLGRRGIVASPSLLLTAMDTLQNRHLPHSLTAAAHWATEESAEDLPGAGPLAVACQALADLVAPLRQPDAGADAVLALLQTVYAARPLDPHAPRDRHFAAAATTIAEAVAGLSAPTLQASCPETPLRLRLLLTALASRRLDPVVTEGLELDGWLELHWNPAPTLVLTGMNEGRVPESVVGHAFLPDTARRALGLLHNDRRLARDAYLLSAMLACRCRTGAVHLILGKVSSDGDTLRPSRLLLRCSDAELPGRALGLFRNLDPEGAHVPWQRAWTLRPPRLPPPNRLAVTAFRDYLACPFRFYLRHVVGMEALDDRKSELDALDFGTLCHGALEALAREPGLRESDDPQRLAGFLMDRARQWVEERFGSDLPAAVSVQLEAACQRLRAAAAVQAQQRAEGWRIVSGEYRLGDGSGVPFEGLLIRGTVDRIDRHRDGRLRILDYKTSEKATPPAQQHLGPAPRAGAPGPDPLATLCEVGGKQRRWQDLQLPLYRLFLGDSLGTVSECGYFALPKAVTETAVLPWDGLTPELMASASRCAAACAAAIRAGRFWPPAEKLAYDDFERLFYGGAAASVDPECVPFLRGRPEAP